LLFIAPTLTEQDSVLEVEQVDSLEQVLVFESEHVSLVSVDHFDREQLSDDLVQLESEEPEETLLMCIAKLTSILGVSTFLTITLLLR
jgi:hypothetical protein